jgi:type 1 glutamine amidotransferase
MHRKETVRISATLSAAVLFSGILVPAQQPAVPRSSAQPGPSGFLNTPGQNMNGMHIFLWAGLKSHGEGQHDYPQWLADWSKLLTQHGAIVDGALHPPSSGDLEHADVLVIYKGDAAYLGGVAKPTIEAFVKRGGGIVSLHDSLCGPDPAYFATLVGGAKRHGDINYTLDAAVPYTIVDKANPIMEGMSDLTLWDEAFFSMTWADNPKVHVLATTIVAGTPSAGAHKGEIAPQIWTYEHNLPGGQPARAFVWMQGHLYTNFSNYQIQQMLLRGIAWAGKQPVNILVDYRSPSPPPHPAATPGP